MSNSIKPTKISAQSLDASTIPLVSIVCNTYQHVNYIAEAINSFLMQETTFPVEILVHDDASTDGTADIVKRYAEEYPCLINPIYQKENQFSKGVKPFANFQFPRARGKYIAFCEGDDYWTDPHKLSKQVDFLEHFPDYVFCYTRFNVLDEKSGIREPDQNEHYFTNYNGIEFNFEVFAKGWHMGTQTLVFKKEALEKNNHFSNPKFRDTFLICDLLTVGKGYCLSNFSAVYRLHPGGIYSPKSKAEKAKIATEIYKEIFLTYKDNDCLKSKYHYFTNEYIKILLDNNLYKEALIVLDDFLQNSFDPDDYKNQLFWNIENWF